MMPGLALACVAALLMAGGLGSDGLVVAAAATPDEAADVVVSEDDGDAASAGLDVVATASDRELAEMLAESRLLEQRWQAVHTIARRGRDPSPELFDAVRSMLSLAPDDAAHTDALALALSRFEWPTAIRELGAIAGDEAATLAARLTAIDALSRQSSRASAWALLNAVDGSGGGADVGAATDEREGGNGDDSSGHTASGAPMSDASAVQSALFDGLERLTGRSDLARRVSAWRGYLEEVAALSRAMWRRELIERHRAMSGSVGSEAAAAMEALGERVDALETTVESVARQWYISARPEDRSGVLAFMLGSGEKRLRRLGLELTAQRLWDGQPFDEPLRAALRGLLNDPHAELRELAARRLYELQDEAAAKVAAVKLREALPLSAQRDGVERSPAVLRVYVEMLGRRPQPGTSGALVELLTSSALRSEAAAALASSVQAGLLSADEQGWVRDGVRVLLSQGGGDPGLVRLMGLVATASDWEGWERWLTHESAVVRRAAAEAWAAHGRPMGRLLTLAERDAALQPMALAWTAESGRSVGVMRSLAAMAVDSELLAAWRKAMVAVASRVDPGAVLDAARAMVDRGVGFEAIEPVLGAGIARCDQLIRVASEGKAVNGAGESADGQEGGERGTDETATDDAGTDDVPNGEKLARLAVQRSALFVLRGTLRMARGTFAAAAADAAEAVAGLSATGQSDSVAAAEAMSLLAESSIASGRGDAAADALTLMLEQDRTRGYFEDAASNVLDALDRRADVGEPAWMAMVEAVAPTMERLESAPLRERWAAMLDAAVGQPQADPAPEVAPSPDADAPAPGESPADAVPTAEAAVTPALAPADTPVDGPAPSE